MLLGLLAVLGVLVTLFLLFSGAPIEWDTFDGTTLIFLIGGVFLILYFLGSLGQDYRNRGLLGLRHFGLWCLIFGALITGYTFRQSLHDVGHRVMAEIVPAGTPLIDQQSTESQSTVRLRKQLDGHFVARGRINGSPIIMLVDTGASTVVLKPSDAERAGIDLGTLNYLTPVQTANGSTLAASIRLRNLSIGDIHLQDIEALVAKPGNLNQSLLGMSFLRRLRSYEFSGDFLTLRG